MALWIRDGKHLSDVFSEPAVHPRLWTPAERILTVPTNPAPQTGDGNMNLPGTHQRTGCSQGNKETVWVALQPICMSVLSVSGRVVSFFTVSTQKSSHMPLQPGSGLWKCSVLALKWGLTDGEIECEFQAGHFL